MTVKQKQRLLTILCVVGIPVLLLGTVCLGPLNPSALPAAAVRITELCRKNLTVLYDEDGSTPAWLELTNTGTRPTSLRGLTLSDNAKEPDAYRLPDTVLAAGESCVVFLTGKADETRPLHAPFAPAVGETLTLYTARGAVQDSLTVLKTEDDISFGNRDGQTVLYGRPTPGQPNSGPYGTDAASLAAACFGGLLISEVQALPPEGGHDWVELQNTTGAPLSLSGYRLTEDRTERGLIFGDLTLAAGEYLVVPCDADGLTAQETADGETLCAPFSVGWSGDTVYLFTPEGVLCDRLDTGKQRQGGSCGRVDGKIGTRVFFPTATPGEPNGEGYGGYAPMPIAAIGSGPVEPGTAVALTVPSGCRVYYTLDGSVPTERDREYTGEPLTVHTTTAVRAVAYREGYLPSDILTRTYFTDDPHAIATLSVVGDPTALYGRSGVLSDYHDDGNAAAVFSEYFAVGGEKAVEFGSEMRISGGLSRSNVQKAFTLNCTAATGTDSIDYPFFADSPLTSFHNLLLRPSGSDWSNAKLRDEFVATALKDTGMSLVQSATPVALYINGKYNGLYYLREKRNERFIAGYTEVPKDCVQIAKEPQLFDYTAERDPDFDELLTYVKRHDMTDPTAYQTVLAQIDAESLMDYFVAETFFGNGDMINNIACWRDSRGGKWQWIIFDMDWACTRYYQPNRFLYQIVRGTGQHTYQQYYYPLMTSLLKNDDFRTRFIQRYLMRMDTVLSAERLTGILDRMASAIEPEIPRQAAAYGAPSVNTWTRQIDYIRSFLDGRRDTMERQLREAFSLTEEELTALRGQ